MKKEILYILILFCFGACSGTSQAPEKTSYRKIVVLGQSALNLLLELGLQDRIVGVAYLENTEMLEEYKGLPILTTNWADKETILALKPDLIFAMEAAFRPERIGNHEFWQKRGIRVFMMDSYRINKCFSDYYKDIDATGELFGIQYKTDSIIEQLKELRSKYAKQQSNRPKVLHLSYIKDREFYYYPPAICLLDEIVEDCGGEYIDMGSVPFIFSLEAIIEANPDKIIVTQYRKTAGINWIELLSGDSFLKHLTAVSHKQVLEVEYTQAIRGTTDMREVYAAVSAFLQQ